MSEQSGRFMRLPDVIAEVSLSESTINRRIRDGEFPKKRSLGGRCVGWWESEIREWKQNRLELAVRD